MNDNLTNITTKRFGLKHRLVVRVGTLCPSLLQSMLWHCLGMTHNTLTNKLTHSRAETSPLGKGWHALPFLCKACYGIAICMTHKPLPTNSHTVGLKHRL